eukprot:TRINITY_DN16515_c0_g1_i1.p1 TRINITY_DN16515_c0_g1~~TRINITY_DN16515_c0_g1_i1.p1  ORF type:complete len:210 (-),score=38.03 TRINITY_DN16515_c0_g1_i1:18-647(-)
MRARPRRQFFAWCARHTLRNKLSPYSFVQRHQPLNLSKTQYNGIKFLRTYSSWSNAAGSQNTEPDNEVYDEPRPKKDVAFDSAKVIGIGTLCGVIVVCAIAGIVSVSIGIRSFDDIVALTAPTQQNGNVAEFMQVIADAIQSFMLSIIPRQLTFEGQMEDYEKKRQYVDPDDEDIETLTSMLEDIRDPTKNDTSDFNEAWESFVKGLTK